MTNRPDQPRSASRAERYQLLESGTLEDQCNALLALTLEDEYDGAVRVILERTNAPDDNLRGLAVLCLGQIARLHRRIPDPAVAIVTAALADPCEYVRVQAASAADDIRQFTPDALSVTDPSWKSWPVD